MSNSINAEGAAEPRVPCDVCGREQPREMLWRRAMREGECGMWPAQGWVDQSCLRLGYEREKARAERAEKTLGEMAQHEVSCAEAIYGSALAKAHALLADIRKMIEDDTTFPGAVLRAEIDRLLGNAPLAAPSAIPAAPPETP